MKKILLFALPVVLFCSFTSREQPVSLYQQKWVLTGITDTGSLRSITTDRVYIQFNDLKKSIGGKGGCNSFGGSVAIKGDSITISRVFSTKMYCEEFQSLETNFFRLLENINRYEIKNGRLLLYAEAGLSLEFKAAE